MDWKRFAQKFLFPPLGIVLLLVVVSAAALVAVFVKGMDTSPLAYVSYVFAFYTLCVLCIFCWKTLPGYWKTGKEKLYTNKIVKRYLTDAAFKTHVISIVRWRSTCFMLP